MILEPGSIHVDGEGTLITTEECLLNPNRNPDLSRDQIEQILCDHCNVDKVLWLGKGVFLDETNGHVDNLCCFVRPGVVALTWTDDESDPQHAISMDALERLSQMTDAKGRRIEVHKIHQPTPRVLSVDDVDGIQNKDGSTIFERAIGSRMAASYVNFYLAQSSRGSGVIVPLFGDDVYDRLAISKLETLFPDRSVVGVPFGHEILIGGGNIHCITQQQPLFPL